MTDWLFWAALVAALACGLLAGVFFTSSRFAMRALDALPPRSAAAAMASINRVILRSLFLPLFLGTALLGALLAAAAAFTLALAPGLSNASGLASPKFSSSSPGEGPAIQVVSGTATNLNSRVKPANDQNEVG